MKKGFTLIEMLVGLLFIPVILSLSLALMHLMKRGIDSEITQIDVFKLQMRQYLIGVGNAHFDGDSIVGSYDNKPFVIAYDRNRLVKTPGYEMLLEGVDSVERQGRCLNVEAQGQSLCIELP